MFYPLSTGLPREARLSSLRLRGRRGPHGRLSVGCGGFWASCRSPILSIPGASVPPDSLRLLASSLVQTRGSPLWASLLLGVAGLFSLMLFLPATFRQRVPAGPAATCPGPMRLPEPSPLLPPRFAPSSLRALGLTRPKVLCVSHGERAARTSVLRAPPFYFFNLVWCSVSRCVLPAALE